MKSPRAICQVEEVNGWTEATTQSLHMNQQVESIALAAGRQKQKQ